ncbi:TRAP transporter small permease [Sulfitobacter sp. 1A12126]|uniref:TRAP transporter small permease n=1 Tax=Sulfitobacter sp. 1A12126 TaxID=3368591 RepID=UPI00374701D9
MKPLVPRPAFDQLDPQPVRVLQGDGTFAKAFERPAIDIISRTILREGFQTANELAIVCFSGVVFFGIIGAALNKQMFGVDYFISRLPRTLERPALMLSHLLVIIIASAVLHAATAQVATARFTTFLALGWPKWIVSAGLAFAMGAIIATQLLHIVILWRRRGE